MRALVLLLLAVFAAAPLDAAKAKPKAKGKDKVTVWKASGAAAPSVRFTMPKAKSAARELSYGRAGQAPVVLLSTLGSVQNAGWAKNGETFAVLMKGSRGGTELFLYDREGRSLDHLAADLEKRRVTAGAECEGKRQPWKALKWRGDQLDLLADVCGRESWISASMGTATVSDAPAKAKSKAKPKKKKAKTKAKPKKKRGAE